MNTFSGGAARLVAALVVVGSLGACGSTRGSTSGSGATAGIDDGASAVTSTRASLGKGSSSAPSVAMSDPMAGMDHGSMGGDAMDPTTGDGTRASELGFTLAVRDQPTRVGRQKVALQLTSADGRPVTEVVVEQTKQMHLIVVRKDLTGYQHVHPELVTDGRWIVDIDFATAGTWRLIADVTPVAADGSTNRIALGVDVKVPGQADDTPLPEPSKVAAVDGYEVTLNGAVPVGTDADIMFSITESGAPATGISEYLGAGGHLVALNRETLAYTHLHSSGGPDSTLAFTAHVPRAGRYRLFLQFATGDTVHTAPFTIDAT